jgi:DNA-directed RNA polymerase subunit RPC12/RpoP
MGAGHAASFSFLKGKWWARVKNWLSHKEIVLFFQRGMLRLTFGHYTASVRDESLYLDCTNCKKKIVFENREPWPKKNKNVNIISLG